MELHMSSENDRTEALRSEFVRALVEDIGMREVIALPFANALLSYFQREYPGQQLYIPAPPRQYDLLQIHAALERGDSPSKVCRDFSMSRRTLFRLFPSGLPKPPESGAQAA